MSISFHCPACGRTLHAPPHAAGKEPQCRSGKAVTVPAAGLPAQPPGDAKASPPGPAFTAEVGFPTRSESPRAAAPDHAPAAVAGLPMPPRRSEDEPVGHPARLHSPAVPDGVPTVVRRYGTVFMVLSAVSLGLARTRQTMSYRTSRTESWRR
jgi:hypothetical protein